MGFGACIWASRPCQGQIEVTAYISNRDSNSLSVVETATNTVTTTITAAIGTGPIGVAVTPDGRFAYVANGGNAGNSNTVSVIDVATNTVVGSVPVGNGPFGVALTPDGKLAYVTNYGIPTPRPRATPSR
jgi:YVTN family beta-propeller protein